MTTPVRRRRPRRASALVAACIAGGMALAMGPSGIAAGTESGTAGSSTSTTTTKPVVAPRGPFVRKPIDPDKVRRTWGNPDRPRKGVQMSARCGTPVVATHPGIVHIKSKEAWRNRVRMKLVSSPGDLVTTYRFLRDAQVVDGQLIQAGQQLGEVPWMKGSRQCKMNFRVRSMRQAQEPRAWLNTYAGRVTPTTKLLGDPGFNIASFNILGASHTGRGGSKASWPDWQVRLPRALDMLERYGAEVVGLQELQKRQHTRLLELAGDTWGIYPPTTESDTENSIIYRKSRFTLLSANTFPVPYFDGHPRQMPYVLLQDNVTGRTAYVINVHNPATTPRWGNQARWRREAIARERQLVIDLRAEGRPVFLTGDFNDRAAAFCPLTEGKLMISPDSIPSMECAMPPYYWVDWIFAAGQARFTSLSVDTSPRPSRITDHPLVIARAHLQN